MSISKIVPIKDILSLVKDGDTVMVGGFMTNGTPEAIIDILATSDIKDLTLICNDAGFEDKGVGKMIAKHQFKKIIATHIGLNREAGRQMTSGETDVNLVPQGTLVEQIRCGAYGIAGFYTPTGVGTLVEEGKETKYFDNKKYLLELPIKADVALIFADIADEMGNLHYSGSENNFNAMMAANAKTTIVQARHIVPVGELAPEAVHTPHVFVDYLVKEGE